MKNKFTFTIYLCISLIIFSLNTLAFPVPEISAEGAILLEPTTNTILYSKNANSRFYPASTTKILTTLILIEEMPAGTFLTKTADSLRQVPSDSSHIGLTPGDSYSYTDGLHAILMSSDNFVSYDMAISNAKTLEAFADKMNQKAISLGALSSNFVNPHGYHNPNHYTTPYDLAQIAIGAFSNPLLTEIAGTPKYNFTIANKNQVIPLTHTAPLLDSTSKYYNSHITAVKTGYHTPAGRTLVAKAVYDNIELIGVVMKTDNPNQFIDMNALFDYGSKNFNTKTFGIDSYYVENNSYSPWAKSSIEYALLESWIPKDMRNYQSSITTNEFIRLIQKVLDSEKNDFIHQYNTSMGESMYASSMPLLRKDAAYIIYNLCQSLSLKPYRFYDEVTIPDINALDDYYKKAIEYVSTTRLLGSPTEAFNPNGKLTYEQAITILYKLDKLFSASIPYAFKVAF